jgi:nucleotide-binding universal stress UspA family protein
VTYAIAVAAQTGAELRLLAVLTVSGAYAMPDVMATSELLMESVEQQGQELLAQAAARAASAGVAHHTVIKWGNVPEMILQTAAEEECDLIVLGSRGLTGFKRLMLGSISNAVAAKAQRPVLVVKQPPVSRPHLWRRVLVATGGSPWSDAAVDHALALAQAQQLDICLLCVEAKRPRPVDLPPTLTSEGKNILALAEARAIASGVTYEAHLAYGNVAATILDTAASQQCDLIILGSRGLTGFKRLMLGSISNAVAAAAPLPVLIVKRFLLP